MSDDPNEYSIERLFLDRNAPPQVNGGFHFLFFIFQILESTLNLPIIYVVY